MQKPKKEADPFEPTSDRKIEKWKKTEVKWEKMVKYRYSRTRQNKPPTSDGKIKPITYTKKQTKRNRDKNKPITDHHKSKTDRQNAKQNRKHRRRAAKNATQRPKTKTAYKNTRPQKEKAPQSKNALQGITKAAHDPQTVNGYIIKINYVLLYFCIVGMFSNRLML